MITRMNPSDAPIPLWQQLQATARMVAQVRQGQSGTVALASVSPRLRAGVQALSFAALRNLGRAQALRQLLAPRQPPAARGRAAVHRAGFAMPRGRRSLRRTHTGQPGG